MPIPLLVWGAIAVGGAVVGWRYRKEISDWFNSPEGQKLLHAIGEAAEGAMEPYRRLLEQAYPMDSGRRREFFRQAKSRMSSSEWAGFVGYSKARTQQELRYMAAWTDIVHVDQER